MILLLLLLLGSWTKVLTAQTAMGNINGQVIDQDNLQSLVGANILLKKDTQTLQTTTTTNEGQFTFESIATGKYLLEVSYLGYNRKTTVVFIESGKSNFLQIRLKEGTTTLPTFELRSSRAATTPLRSLGAYILTVEETRRFPANFDDPARLVQALPGVSNSNDQNNSLVVRGNSPNGLSWRLQGAEIVSPNHLSNAGTFSDRASRNAGGVNILSGQLLGVSNFLSGPFTAEFGNVTSGVLDMHLRNGNNISNTFTAQASLLGFDVAAEGPLNKESRSSYLVNYRYSFTGLLADMGVDFDGEEIRFQDLAFHFNFPLNNNSQLSFFGMGGLSSNDFTTERDASTWTTFKETQDIRYTNDMGAFGLNYIKTFPNAVWKTSLVASALKTDRKAIQLNNEFNPISDDEDLIQQSKYVLHSVFSKKINSKHRYRIGLQFKYGSDEVFSSFVPAGGTAPIVNGADKHILLQPYAEWEWQATNDLQLTTGLRISQQVSPDETAIEPSIELRYQAISNHAFALAYQHTSQQALPELRFSQTPMNSNNTTLGFSRSHYIAIGHEWSFNKGYANLKTTAFYQHHYDVPEDIVRPTEFSAINLLESFVNEYYTLDNQGRANHFGVELSYDQFLFEDYFFLLNATIFDATYKDAFDNNQNSRFNSNYVLNLTGGKEWEWTKKGRGKTLGVNLRFSLRGGYWEESINLLNSRAAGYTIFDEFDGFSTQQEAYHRLDLRIYLKNNKERFTSLFSLDIQNVLNRENEAYSFYDPFVDAIVKEKQLGLIPNLSYRVTF